MSSHISRHSLCPCAISISKETDFSLSIWILHLKITVEWIGINKINIIVVINAIQEMSSAIRTTLGTARVVSSPGH